MPMVVISNFSPVGYHPPHLQPLHIHKRTRAHAHTHVGAHSLARPHNTQTPVKGRCLNQGVAYTSVTKHSRVPTDRSLTSRVLSALLENIAYCLSHEVQSVAITVSGIGEAVIENHGHFGVRFGKEFVEQLRNARGVQHGSTLSTLQAKRQVC